MLETASLIIINLVIAGIIGFILGYVVGKNNFPKIESIHNDRVDDSRDDRIKSTLNPMPTQPHTIPYKLRNHISSMDSFFFVIILMISCIIYSAPIIAPGSADMKIIFCCLFYLVHQIICRI